MSDLILPDDDFAGRGVFFSFLNHLPVSPTVSRETIMLRLDLYAKALAKWNASVNLVSRETIASVWVRHFLDSAQLFGMVRGSSIVDLGSGAGFPGMVLAIMEAGVVSVVDKDRKKCSFLRLVSSEVGVPVSVVCGLFQDVSSHDFDVVVSRACAPVSQLLSFSLGFFSSGGGKCVFLKGANWLREVDEAYNFFDFNLDDHESLTSSSSRILVVSDIRRRS